MSTTKRLTDISVRNLKSKSAAFAVPDGGSGLYCIVQPSGHRSFAVMYRVAGKQAKLGLGAYPATSLAEARKLAIDARESAAKGIDPSDARRKKQAEAALAEVNTVASVCAKCIESKGAKLRSADKQRRILKRLVYSEPLGGMPINQVKRRDVVKLLDKIANDNGGRMADVVLMLLRRTFNWYERRDDDWRSPIARGMGEDYYKASEHVGDRILNDDELRRLWAATEDATPFSQLVRFLVLVGCRRNEAAGIRRAEIEGDVWRLPPSRSKTKHEVVRPLSKAALRIVEDMPVIDGCPWVFSTTGLGPFTNLSDTMRALRERSGINAAWRLHDLRRTARSLMSRAGVNPDVAERCLGHALPGVRGVYDKHDYLAEMRHAFESLASLIERIVNPPEGAVIDWQEERAARR
jgi:integrase